MKNKFNVTALVLAAVLSLGLLHFFITTDHNVATLSADSWRTQTLMSTLESAAYAQAAQLDPDFGFVTDKDGKVDAKATKTFVKYAQANSWKLLDDPNFGWKVKDKDETLESSATLYDQDSAAAYGTFYFENDKMVMVGNLASLDFNPLDSYAMDQLLETVISDTNGENGPYKLNMPENITFTYSIPQILTVSTGEVYDAVISRTQTKTFLNVVLAGASLLVLAFALLWPYEKEKQSFFGKLLEWPIALVFVILAAAAIAGFVLWSVFVNNGWRHLLVLFGQNGWGIGRFTLFAGMAAAFFAGFLLEIFAALWIKSLFTKHYIASHSLLVKGSRTFINQLRQENWMKKVLQALILFVLVSVLVFLVRNWLLFVLAASFAVWFVWRLASNMQKEYEAVLNSAQALAQSRLDDVKPAPCGIYETMDKALLDVKDNYVKEVQNALTSQSAQTELVSNVSHDLKTPMTGILTYADLLETADNLDQAKQYAAKISAYTKRLASLTDDLFDVSKAQAGALPLDAASLDLAALIEETAADYQKALDENKLELVLKLHCANVHLDPDKTMRIFDNLLSNAVKYSLEGSRIFVEMTDTDDAVSVVVRNISKQPLDLTEEEVVRRFVRGDASRTDAGAGIGLAIAQSFAKAQEGSLDIRILNDVFEAVVTLPKEKKQA